MEMMILADANPVLEVILARRSIRRYKNEPVSDTDLRLILEAARSAPSAANLQNFSIIVVKEHAKIERLWEFSNKQPWVKACSLLLVFVVDTFRHKRWCELSDADYHHDNFFSVIWGMTDAIAAAQNAVIAAQGLGLGTVYIGTVLGRMQEMIDLLKLPRATYPVAMLCLGVPRENPEPRDKVPLESIVHWDEFRQYSDEEVERAFASREEKFTGTAKASDDVRNLAQYITRKRFTRDVLLNRAKSAMQALIEQGFWNEEHLNYGEDKS
jgi:nitroreductase